MERWKLGANQCQGIAFFHIKIDQIAVVITDAVDSYPVAVVVVIYQRKNAGEIGRQRRYAKHGRHRRFCGQGYAVIGRSVNKKQVVLRKINGIAAAGKYNRLDFIAD